MWHSQCEDCQYYIMANENETYENDAPVYLPIFRSYDDVNKPEDEYSTIGADVTSRDKRALPRVPSAQCVFVKNDVGSGRAHAQTSHPGSWPTQTKKAKCLRITKCCVLSVIVVLLLLGAITAIGILASGVLSPNRTQNGNASSRLQQLLDLTKDRNDSQPPPCAGVVSQDLTFTPRTLTPMETMTSSALDDHDDGTCLTFVPGHDSSGYRQHVTELTFYVNLSPGSQGLELRGMNLDCGASVTLTTVVERPGHGLIEDDPCVLTDSRQEVDLDSCVYSCLCPETGCHKLQLSHKPPAWPALPWQLCEINDRGIPSGCLGYKSLGYTDSGVYSVRLHEGSDPAAADVFCDMTSNEPYLMLMRRFDGSENFTRDWYSYKRGFGCLDGEFWLGNDIIHALTSEESQEMKIVLRSFADEVREVVYGSFSVGDEATKYNLKLNTVTERNMEDKLSRHSGQPFSTYDKDNDPSHMNCAGQGRGGWWYSHCGPVQLTGLYGRAVPDGQTRIRWRDWLDNGDVYYPISSVDMKLRPRLLRPEDAADCLAYRQAGYGDDGVYEVSVGGTLVEVYCDMTTDGGGWTLLMRRQDGSQDFNLYWVDYKYGFGSLEGEFWLGNDLIHDLTSQGHQELRVDLRSFVDDDYPQVETRFVVYDRFSIGDERDNYRLSVGQHTGGDLGQKAADEWTDRNNGQQFSTRDRDNDVFGCCNCAEIKYGAGWHEQCTSIHLTGLYGLHVEELEARLRWCYWVDQDQCYNPFIQYVDMKFRRVTGLVG